MENEASAVAKDAYVVIGFDDHVPPSLSEIERGLTGIMREDSISNWLIVREDR